MRAVSLVLHAIGAFIREMRPALFLLLAVGSFRSKPTDKNVGWKKGKTEQFGSIGNTYIPELPDSLLGRDVNYPRIYAHSHRQRKGSV
jgi:hypothetical protein